MKVGDLVECNMPATRFVRQLGVVVQEGRKSVMVHFTNLHNTNRNPRWISVEYLKVVS